MKKLIGFLSVIILFTACTKQDILEEAPQQQESDVINAEIPVNFNYSSPGCERPEITLKGETYSDTTIITSDSTVHLRSDQKYTVTFSLTADRCTSGALILAGEDANEVNLWLGSYPAKAEKQHINLEAKYYIVVLGE